MGIEQVLFAPRSLWQRAYVERAIGTIRRESLDHVVIFSEAARYGQMKSFVEYYHRSRPHLSLSKDSAGVAGSAVTPTRTNRGYSASRRSPSPIRATRSVKKAEQYCSRKGHAAIGRFLAFGTTDPLIAADGSVETRNPFAGSRRRLVSSLGVRKHFA